MLSPDDHHKRKNIQRQRSRLIPPPFGTIPHTVPTKQLPSPEQVSRPYFNSANAMQPPKAFPDRYSGNDFPPSPPAVPGGGNTQNIKTMVDDARETDTFINPTCFSQINSRNEREQQTEKIVTSVTRNTPPLRERVVISGDSKTSTEMFYLPHRRRFVVHGAVSVLLLFMITSALVSVAPIGNSGKNTFQPIFTVILGRKNETALIASQIATSTAVTEDGYDPGNMHFAGVLSDPGNLYDRHMDRFFYGQCTYWANMRYHQLTGHWIPWLGNAYQWAYQAPAYGWTLSDSPNPHGHSIMVFRPYGLGSGAYGHVAVVEKVNSDGSVLTSSWNWNGMWATKLWMTFYPVRGEVSFIWDPH
jgi:surface antigen